MHADGALRAGVAMGCGSLPHADPAAATQLVLEATPSLPAAPSLPRWRPAEGMVAQAAFGLAGVEVAPDGSLHVDPDALRPGQAFDHDDELPGAAFGALLAFLDSLSARGHDGPVKVQVTGPVTLGVALVAAGVPARTAFSVAGAAAPARMRQVLAATRARLPEAPIVAVVDEPSLGGVTLGGGPIGVEDAVDLVSSTLATAEHQAVTGLHCCAPADWGVLVPAGPQVLSLPVELAGSLRAGVLGPFLEKGGWVAWGAVPTDGPLGGVDGEGRVRLWRSLAARWHALADSGVDPVLLRSRALVTPACGLAFHDESQAALALRMTAAIGDRIAVGSAEAVSPRS